MTRQLDFANLMLEKIDLKEIDLKKMWFSDEAHFHLNGYVNKQNWRHWGTENPHLAVARPAYPRRVTVWCAMSSELIIGPIFIDGSVTSEKYLELLERDFFPVIRRKRLVQGYWYQQDGARPHRTQQVLESLSAIFHGLLIALDYDRVTDRGLEWPPYSPDLNCCDFFLWGNIKDRVCRTPPRTIDDLKEVITREIRAIESEVLQCVFDNFEKRFRNLVIAQGAHFENLLH